MLHQFEKENAKSEMMQEVMGDAIDDAMDTEGNEEEEEHIVQQVLDEIGISFDGEIPNAPGAKLSMGGGITNSTTPVAETAGGMGDTAVDELEERLNNLKR